MPVQKLENRQSETPAISYAEIDLTPEMIERYVAKGRRERSEFIVGGLLRAFARLRRWLDGQRQADREYPLSGGARP